MNGGTSTSASHPSRFTPWTPHAARIRGIHHDITDTATYDVEFEDAQLAANYRFLPGQFNMLYLPGFGESAISISSDPDRCSMISHTIRAVGNVTHAVRRCQVGDIVFLRGPFGSIWPLQECVGQDVIIASGGLGLAPLRPVVYEIARHRGNYGNVYLLYGARTPAGLLYADEYDQWRSAGIDVRTTVDFADDVWTGHIGVVPLLLDGLRLSATRTRVFTCGPEIMMRFVIFAARARHIARNHIWLSMERNMNCAVGFCGHCQLGPAFVCKDGPVFGYEQMEPYLNIADL